MSVAPSISPSDVRDAAAIAAARTFCRREAKAFYFSSVFLPRQKRDAAYSVFAFGRLIEQAMGRDECESAAGAGSSCCGGDGGESRFNLIRDRLDAIYDDRVELPLPEFRDESQHILAAAGTALRHYEIPREPFLDLAEACRAESGVARYPTWSRLQAHCAGIGGSMTRTLATVLGLRHSEGHRYAAALGTALRLTQILRDVRQDFDRGRIYLPLEDMARFRYSERDLAAGAVNDAWRDLMRFEITRARNLYRESAEGICWLADDGSRLAAAAMVTISAGVLRAIERRDFDVFSRRVDLTTAQKFRRLPQAWRLAKREANQPMPNVFES